MKVLIVDDERAIRNSLKEILGDEGDDVDTAEDGAAALEMTANEKYDVIFCDIKMPNMDGIEVLDTMIKNGIARQMHRFAHSFRPFIMSPLNKADNSKVNTKKP